MLLLNGVLSILLYYYLGIKGIVFGSLFSSLFFVTIILSKEKIWKQYINKVFLNPILGGVTILIILAYLL
jgi:H+/Cl- antiporter ClcA